MFYLIVFLLITFSSLRQALKCSTSIPIHHQYSYLCREKMNSTTLRIWLHWRFNRTVHHRTSLAFYRFTLRTIDLVEEKKLSLEDRFERTISDASSLDFQSKENHSIIIRNLHPGRYEICVEFLNQQKTIYSRTLDSCLRVPWRVSEHVRNQRDSLIEILLMICIIVLLATIAFVIYAFHRFIQSFRTPTIVIDARDNDDEEKEKEEEERPPSPPIQIDDKERARLLMHRHFVQDTRPLEALVHRRIHQRYAHRSAEFE